METNSFLIREPADIAGKEDAAIGDFGVPLYGATLIGSILYPSSNRNGCSAFSEGVHQDSTALPPILLVDRGDCYFVEKAFNAEQAGYKAIMVADNVEEGLLTMALPEDRPEIAKLIDDITIPTALVTKAVGDRLKLALNSGSSPQVVVELDWKESMAHLKEKVDWQLWTSSSDGCGTSCARQSDFKKAFSTTAQQLQQDGYVTFESHFMMRRCGGPPDSQACQDNCINKGRYCAMDTIDEEWAVHYKGWQVVEENKRQLCMQKVASDAGKPWLWWQYASLFATHCRMHSQRFNDACAEEQVQATGLNYEAVQDCMGDSRADMDNPLMEDDLRMQNEGPTDAASRIIMLPTVIVNDKQYRGRLDAPSITRALCAGFDESTEPEVCLQGMIQVDDCEGTNHECWADDANMQTACKDTFRGYICQCPPGYRGDGKSCVDIDECAEGSSGCDQTCVNEPGTYHCECADGFNLFGGIGVPGFCFPKDMCGKDNGRCEQLCYSQNGQPICSCGRGLQLAADGKSCEDVDECAAKTHKCQGQCINKDPRESGMEYQCQCGDGKMTDPANRFKCIEANELLAQWGVSIQNAASKMGGATVIGIILAAALIAVAAGYALQRFKGRREMQTEIHAIMRQYMPLNADDDGTTSLLQAEHGDSKKKAELKALHPGTSRDAADA